MKEKMKLSDFDYNLPTHLIAQRPLDKRSSSKLLVMDKVSGKLTDTFFNEVVNYFNKGDVLVLNDSKVIPARLHGLKKDTLAKVEVFLLNEVSKDRWLCLAKPMKRLKVGNEINFSNVLTGKVVDKFEDKLLVEFFYEGIFLEILEQIGLMPLPPYIKETLEKKDRYQTVYAKHLGSSAAPTAGLHFTGELLNKLKEKGVEILYITLHVGIGTFKPVMEEDITKHIMHEEYFSISAETAEKLNKAFINKKKIFATGTTSVRVLETVFNKYNKFKKCSESTDIFIYPGYEFKVIDGLITNFHLPKSTLLMLVSAFTDLEYIKKAYIHAIEKEYRFFSFGDAMLIHKEK